MNSADINLDHRVCRTGLPRVYKAFLSLVVLVSVFSAVPNTQATLLEGFDFSTQPGGTNNYGNSPLSPITLNSSVTAIPLTRGSGVGTTGTGAAAAFGGTNFSTGVTTEAGAITANQVFTFGLTVASGSTISLTDLPAYNVRRSGTAPSTGIFQYSVNSGSFIDIGSAITWGAVTTSAGNSEPIITLSGISDLQNLAAGTSVTFRIVDWNATGTSGGWYLNDLGNTTTSDFGINGTIAPVPEPATVFGGLLLVGIAFWTQRGRLRGLLSGSLASCCKA